MTYFCFFHSGYASGNILKVLEGEDIGTLFHRDAHLWVQSKDVSAREMAVAARESSRILQVESLALWFRLCVIVLLNTFF